MRIEAEFDCWPVWIETPTGVDNVDPCLIGLSTDLAKALLAWAAEYDLTLDQEDPLRSGFSSPEDSRDFERRGVALAKRIAGEVGHRYHVVARVDGAVVEVAR